MFNSKKLNEVEGKERYSVEISNSFANLGNLDTKMDISRVWKLSETVS
jgi:translation initiation factor IF-1